jgi:hypothetical protein
LVWLGLAWRLLNFLIPDKLFLIFFERLKGPVCHASVRGGESKRVRIAEKMTVSRFRVILYNGRFTETRIIAKRGFQFANAQENQALANIFEGDLALYRMNAPVRTATHPGGVAFSP